MQLDLHVARRSPSIVTKLHHRSRLSSHQRHTCSFWNMPTVITLRPTTGEHPYLHTNVLAHGTHDK